MPGFKGPSGSTPTTKTTTVHIGTAVGAGQFTQLSSWFKDLNEALIMAKKSVGDLTPIWKEAEKIIKQDINQLFDSSGKNVTSSALRWPALSKNYKKRKAAEGKGTQPILVWHGTMRDSIDTDRITSNSLKITARDPKARIHHWGLVTHSKTSRTGKMISVQMPRRAFMYMSSEAIDEILLMISDYTGQALEGRKPRIRKRRQFLKRR
ncbi:MAG: phage virion morphogenesis protein [Thermodesulfovibrionia bacterium]|nr:phage virion morphogenesis protein [Thermodesulfovibrionia bacterium]